MLLRVRNMEPIEIEREKIEELRYIIDQIFNNDHDEIDIEMLRFDISDILDFMDIIDNDEREEILRLIDEMMINKEAKIYYQLHVRLQLLETRVNALTLGLLLDSHDSYDSYEEEKEDNVVNENKANIGVNDIASKINKIGVSSI